MNLSEIINHGRQRPQHTRQTPSTQRHSDPSPRRQLARTTEDMATAMTATHYRSQSPGFSRPHPPPSPPLDDLQHSRLPSIHSLMMQTGHPADEPHAKDHHPSHFSPTRSERSHDPRQPTVSHPAMRPLSPPIDPQLVFDGPLQSPTATTSSQSSVTSRGPHSGGRYSPSEPGNGPPQSPTFASPRGSGPAIDSPQSYQQHPYGNTPASAPEYAYPPVAAPGPQNMYHQRALPASFAPNMPTNLARAPPASGETSPVDMNAAQWQQQQHEHHHYISPPAGANYHGQSSDRYVCPTCNKAFSRPSSLRIHVHSHTGEKPFLCPYKGCGKAFSVRSNMKRHERGCHGSSNNDG